MNTLVLSLSRLKLAGNTLHRSSLVNHNFKNGLHTSTINHFKLTDAWYAVGKKKRRDPVQDKVKSDRRRKRLAKALKKMEKQPRQPKPIIELEVPDILKTDAAARNRNAIVSEEVSEDRHYFMKDWSHFALKRHRDELWELDRKLLSQQKALDKLREESMELYLEACQFDPNLIPFTAQGPTLTPPIKDYIQDGDYKDITREYKVVYEDTELFLKKLVTKVRRKKRSEEEED